METIFNKQIHKKDFRLRILVTNGCNKECYNCLNDFQSKPVDKISFLDPATAIDIIKSYCLLTRTKKDIPQVEISGGEPGIYPALGKVVSYAKECGAYVKVNTNGTAFNRHIDPYVDCWHVGVTKPEQTLVDSMVKRKAQIQFVVGRNNIRYVRSIIEFYGQYGIPIKLFIDFFAGEEEELKIRKIIINIINSYPDFAIETRHTGVQENRGKLCNGCKKRCITLKALWVFTDGKVSPCPQGVIKPEHFSNDILEAAFIGHSAM